MAMPSKPPMVRGASDIQITRSGPGALNVTHRATGTKVGAMVSKGDGWTATHASGTTIPKAHSVSQALAGLIAYHNKMAAGKPDSKTVAATAEPRESVDLATPVASASDGPRVTTMSAGKKPANVPAVKLSPVAARVFTRLRKKGLAPKAALAMARRADAMRGKKTVAKAA